MIYIKGFPKRNWQLCLYIKRNPLEIFPKIVYRLEIQSEYLLMELNIVHIANTISSGTVDSLEPFFKDLFTPFGGNDLYFVFNVGSEFFQCRRLVGINQWFDESINFIFLYLYVFKFLYFYALIFFNIYVLIFLYFYIFTFLYFYIFILLCF